MGRLRDLVANPRLYSIGTAVYDRVTRHRLQGEVFGEVSVRLPDAGRFLDLACGPGVLLARLRADAPARRGIGVDLAAGALRRTLRYAPAVLGRAEALPFGDATFDGAVISGALYLVRDPVQVLREMARVTRGPVLVLDASPRLTYHALFAREYRLGWRERLDYAFWIPALRAARCFTAESLGACLREAGLGEVAVEEIGRGLYVLGSGRN